MALEKNPHHLPYLSEEGLKEFRDRIGKNITDKEWDFFSLFYGSHDLTDDALDAVRNYLQSVGLLFGERLKKKKRSRTFDDDYEALPARPSKRRRSKLMMDAEGFTEKANAFVERPLSVPQKKGDFRDRLPDKIYRLSDVAARAAAEKPVLPEEDEVPSGHWGDCFRLILRCFKLNGSGPHRGEFYFAGFDIGTWLYKQHTSKKLTSLQKSLIYRIPGFAPTKEESWEIHFKLLAEFAEKYDCLPTDISSFLVYKGVRIAHWENAMRERMSDMRMDHGDWLETARRTRLETIRGWHW